MLMFTPAEINALCAGNLVRCVALYRERTKLGLAAAWSNICFVRSGGVYHEKGKGSLCLSVRCRPFFAES